VVALLGVGGYFLDRHGERQTRADGVTLSYIERYAADPVLDARMVLYAFWLEQPDFLAHARTNPIPPAQYAYFVETRFREFSDADSLRRSLITLDNFFDEMLFCRADDVCNTDRLDSYFCPEIQRHAEIYGAFYAVIRTDLVEEGFGVGVSRLAEACAARGTVP